jgi:hypothetical protein
MADLSDRRSFMRKAASLAALGALGSAVLERLPVPVSGATAGDIAFSDGTASGVTFDDPNFFWDATNHRLGVNYGNPPYPLTVQTSENRAVLYFHCSAAHTTEILFDSVAGQQALFDFLDGGAEKWQIGKQTDNSFFFWDQVNLTNFIYANPTTKVMAFDAQAKGYKVGIATTSPTQMLTVAGDVGQSIVSANGLVKAAVLVNGSSPSIIRSFNNLPGGSAPSVSQPLGPGTYDVNFGVNVAQRFFLATLLSSNATDAGGASDGQVLASTSDRSTSAVFVRTNDTTGTSTNRSFYLMIF